MTPADYLRTAMDAQGITDAATRAGLAAISMGESRMQGYTEQGYSHTNDARIHQVFGGRVALPDATIDALKADDRTFFDLVYGGAWGLTNLGNNPGTDDGYDFRGRGFIQLTGRSNYQRYSTEIGHPEIMNFPDLANEPDIAAALTVAYILDRYHGGGFEAMMASVGNNTPDIAATKRDYYRQYLASGEFAAGTASSSQPAHSPPAAVADAAIPSAITLQTALQLAGFYKGAFDGIFGPQSATALVSYYASLR